MEHNNKQELLNKTKSTNNSECTNYNSDDQNLLEKKLKDCTKTISEFYPLILSGISLVSVICYLIYFSNIGYFPAISGSDIFYFGGLIFFVSFLISLLFIMPTIFFPGYHNDKFCIPFIASVSILLMLPFMLSLLFIGEDYITSLVVSFIACVSYIDCIAFFDKRNKKEMIVFVLLLIVTLLLSCVVCYNTATIEFAKLVLFAFLIMGCILVPHIFLYIAKDIYNNKGYKWLLSGMIIFVPIYSSSVLANSIAGWFGIGNINYKYLVIEKSALGALPDEISKNSTNTSSRETYYDEDKISGTIKLRNIKVLSTLGKFYYLETKDGVKFELDSSKIISRAKE
jgi:putative membrane protein